MLRGETARLPGTDMPDDYHAPMPRRNPEDIDLGAIKADLEFLTASRAASQGASAQAALDNGRIPNGKINRSLSL